MKTLFDTSHVRGCIAAAAALLVGANALAAEPPNAKDLTQGSWEADLVKSKFCMPAPKKSHREIVEAGWGLVSVHWTGIDANSKPEEYWYVYRFDGQKYPASIDSAADEAITWKLVSPHRVEFTHWDKKDKITEELYREVSADGQTMTQSRKYLGAKAGGKAECVDVQVFQRVK